MRTLKNCPHLILVKKSGKCQKNTLETRINYKTRKTRKNTLDKFGKILQKKQFP